MHGSPGIGLSLGERSTTATTASVVFAVSWRRPGRCYTVKLVHGFTVIFVEHGVGLAVVLPPGNAGPRGASTTATACVVLGIEHLVGGGGVTGLLVAVAVRTIFEVKIHQQAEEIWNDDH